jgi:hypothetical protein
MFPGGFSIADTCTCYRGEVEFIQRSTSKVNIEHGTKVTITLFSTHIYLDQGKI